MLILEQDEFLLEKLCVCEKEKKREKGMERGERGRKREEEKL